VYGRRRRRVAGAAAGAGAAAAAGAGVPVAAVLTQLTDMVRISTAVQVVLSRQLRHGWMPFDPCAGFLIRALSCVAY
jgi:hypothetical protein